MILVIIPLVGIKGVCDFAIVDNTMSPTLTGWVLILFVWPTAGSYRIAKLFRLAFHLCSTNAHPYVLIIFLLRVVLPCILSSHTLTPHWLVCGHAELK
jgi:hypothetical protein